MVRALLLQIKYKGGTTLQEVNLGGEEHNPAKQREDPVRRLDVTEKSLKTRSGHQTQEEYNLRNNLQEAHKTQ